MDKINNFARRFEIYYFLRFEPHEVPAERINFIKHYYAKDSEFHIKVFAEVQEYLNKYFENEHISAEQVFFRFIDNFWH